MRNALACVLVLAMGTMAMADVGLSFNSTPIDGTNFWRTIVSAYDTSDFSGSFATSNLVITATGGVTFNQLKVLGAIDVNTESDANAWNGQYGYTKALDTWYYNVSPTWGVIAPNSVSVNGTTTLTMNNLATAGGDKYQYEAPLLHLVHTEGFVDITGGIARNGVIYSVAGAYFIPEPSTLALLGSLLAFGAVALLRRKR